MRRQNNSTKAADAACPLEARRSFTLKYQHIFFLIKIMTPQNASMDEHSLQTSPNGPCFRTVSVCLSVCLNGRGSEEMPHLSMTKGFLIDGGGESS